MTGLRIAYVLATTAGGTGRHVVMLATGCAEAGSQVSVFGPAGIGPMLAASPGSSPAFEVMPIGTRPRPGKDAAAVRRLREALRRAAPAVVHAHGLRAGALTALALRPLSGSPWPAGKPAALVVTMHNAAPSTASAAAVYGTLERLVARRADVVLCVSADLIARMRRLGAREVGLAVVPAPAAGSGATPAADQAQAAADAFAADGRPVVLAAGRLTTQKGMATLVAAAARWRTRQPEPVLVVAGSGPLAGSLARQAAEFGVDVRFLGWRDDTAALIAAADVFVLPSRWEGQSLVLQEALRAGRPIVATDVGGVREITADAALLVSPGDPQALASAVLRVLDDAELSAELSMAAAARSRELPDEAAAIAAAMALYERLS